MVETGIRAVFGAVYSTGYLLLTLITVGAGHGTTFLACGLISLGMLIFGLLLVSWIDGAVTVPSWLDKSGVRSSILIVMILGYAAHVGFFLLIEAPSGFDSTIGYFRLEPVVLALAIGWWAIGQVGFWLIYSWSNRRSLP